MNSTRDLDVQVRSLNFVVSRLPNPEWHLTDNQNPDFYVLGYAKSGCAVYNFSGEIFPVKKGTVILIKQNQLYSAKSDPDNPWHFYSVAFSLDFPDAPSRALLDNLPNIFTSSDSSRMAENFAELQRIWSLKETGYLIKCRSLILDILYILLSDKLRRGKASAHYARIEELVNMMQENFTRSYSLEELCTIAGLSSSHFRTLFKEMTGMSVIQFQNRLKIDHAKDLILSRNCTVTEAAYAVGFNDVYYFSRMFRKLTGKNPSEYLH